MLEESFLSNSVISLFTDDKIEDQEIKLCVLCQFNLFKDGQLIVRPEASMYLHLFCGCGALHQSGLSLQAGLWCPLREWDWVNSSVC